MGKTQPERETRAHKSRSTEAKKERPASKKLKSNSIASPGATRGGFIPAPPSAQDKSRAMNREDKAHDANRMKEYKAAYVVINKNCQGTTSKKASAYSSMEDRATLFAVAAFRLDGSPNPFADTTSLFSKTLKRRLTNKYSVRDRCRVVKRNATTGPVAKQYQYRQHILKSVNLSSEEHQQLLETMKKTLSTL